MDKHIARVNGWVKYDDFDPLKHVFSDEIVLYIKGMYQEAAKEEMNMICLVEIIKILVDMMYLL